MRGRGGGGGITVVVEFVGQQMFLNSFVQDCSYITANYSHKAFSKCSTYKIYYNIFCFVNVQAVTRLR